MKRRILLVDDEVAVLLTLKAVLELNGFAVDTAASGREGRSKLRANPYHMVITDMRMESDSAGVEVIAAAQQASYHPAIALLTAYPITEEDWQAMGADKMLVKPTHTQTLLHQIEKLLAAHEAKFAIRSVPTPRVVASNGVTKPAAKKAAAKKSSAKPAIAKKSAKILKMASKTAARGSEKAGAAAKRTAKAAKR
jgi:DNA-binding response OmpR family regulator